MNASHNQQKWRAVLQQQRHTNAERWLRLLQQQELSPQQIIKEYDNLLRALEYILYTEENFDLSYALIECLFPEVSGFADWDRWLVYLQQAQLLSQQVDRPEEEASLAVQMGDIYIHQGHFEQAKRQYQRAKAFYAQLNHPEKQAVTMSKLAVVVDMQGQEGLRLCQEAVAIAHSTQNYKAMADVQINLSHIYMRMRQWEPGLAAAERAYTLYQQLAEPTTAVKAFFNMVTCWERLGRWGEAEPASQQLLETLGNLGDVHTLAKLKNNLGVIAFYQSKWSVAEQNWQEALQLQSQLGDPTEHALLLNNLGLVYTRLGEYAAAEEMLRQAMRIQHELGDPFNWANAADNLADLYVVMGGDTAVAHSLQQQAMATLAALDAPHAQKLLADIQKKQVLSPIPN